MQPRCGRRADGRRKLLGGLVGAPGAGKSTLARLLGEALGEQRAQVVPMDGFHLAQAEPERLGRGAQAAQDWMAATDGPNARLVEATRSRAHRIVRLGECGLARLLALPDPCPFLLISFDRRRP